MPDGEYQQWVDSLETLLKGDIAMLDRIITKDPGQDLSRATPAPSSRRLRVYVDEASKRQQDDLVADGNGVAADRIPVGGPPVTVVKQEHADVGEEAPAADGAVEEPEDVNVGPSSIHGRATNNVTPVSKAFTTLGVQIET
jgi:hypothetical protein